MDLGVVNTFFLTFGEPLYNHTVCAGVVKLVDAGDSKSPARKGIPVRPRAPAPKENQGVANYQ